MATDEEITTEAEKQYGAWIRCDDITSMKLLERLIKKGIQMQKNLIKKRYKGQKAIFYDDLIEEMKDD